MDVSATFMGLPIFGGVCRALRPALQNAEAALLAIGTAQSLGIRSVSGFQGGGFHGLHSWGLALDINYVTNPYIMHESGERALDDQLRHVFHRICHFLIINNPDHPDSDSSSPRAVAALPLVAAELPSDAGGKRRHEALFCSWKVEQRCSNT